MARVLIAIVGTLCSFYCINAVSAIGWVLPLAPITGGVNDTFKLKCILNMNSPDARGLNSSYLMFYDSNDVPVPREQLKILNSSTVELTVKHAQQYHGSYTCKLNDTWGIDIRSVNIGYKPQEVKDFKCRAPKWDKLMVCTFTYDEANPVAVKYNLVFHFPPIEQNFRCTLNKTRDGQQKCIITMNEGYRLVNEYYFFILTASNDLGTITQNFTINHFDVVIPYMWENCTIDAITSDSAVLKWRRWYKYDGFNRNFLIEVKLLSIYDNHVWQIMNTENLHRVDRNYSLPLRGLKYAATRYDVRFRMRTNSSEQGDDMWSDYGSCLFSTLPRKPDMPPDVAVGSFENSNEHRLFVYWRELNKWQYNSANGFYYQITMQGPDDKEITQWARTSGVIDLNRPQDMNYTFVIRSVNTEGISVGNSSVFVPSIQYRLAKPVIEKLLSDAGKFTLSWKPPAIDASSITSYTVFWCNTTSNSPNDCNGSINFTTVASNQTTFVLENGGVTLNFAVSANSGQLSSGMVWAACTATHKTDIGKLKTIWITETGSNSIQLQWKPECGDVVHTGYMIYYCNINEPRMQDCKEPELSVNLTNKNQHSCLLDNLKSYATYKIEIAMYSETHIGPRSEAVVNTTRESAPSEPRQLTIRKVTKNSVTLHWNPPLNINGGMMSYEILYNGFSHKLNVERNDMDVEKTLENLMPFTEYNITVRAHTVADSPVSNVVRVRTLLGEPQLIAQPNTTGSSGSRLKIGWNPPANRSGCLEFYQLKITSRDVVIYQQRKTECQLRKSICQTPDSSKYDFSVRAVNVDIVGEGAEDFEKLSCDKRWEVIEKHWPAVKRYIAFDECGTDVAVGTVNQNGFADGDQPPPNVRLLYGNPWSVSLTHHCFPASEYGNFVPLILGSIVFLCFLLCAYSYVKVKHVLQVQVIIPDGLNDIIVSSKPGFNVINAGGLILSGHDNIVTGCTKDEGYTKEQNQCLLQSSSSSGGSISDLSGGNDQRSSQDFCSNSACCDEDSTSFYDQEAERQDLRDGLGDDESDTIDSNHLDELQSQSQTSTKAETATADDSFGQANTGCSSGTSPLFMVMNGRDNQRKTTAQPMPPITSGYVPAPTVNSTRQQVNSGYLQIGALSNGGGMMPPLDSVQKSFNVKMAAAPISGYVTHKQLSDYGQHLQ